MPRQPPSLASDRLFSLVAGSAGRDSGRGADDDLVARLERGWVPVEPGSVTVPGRGVDADGDADGEAVGGAVGGAGGDAPGPRLPGRHRDPRGRRGPAVVTLPVSLRGARIDVSWVGIAALVVVLAVAALVFAVRVARADSGVAPAPVAGSTPLGVVRSSTPAAFVSGGAPGGASGGAAGGAGVGGAAGAASPATSPTTIMVHVVGQVKRPGVVTLPAGARIGDAVTRAGGPLPGADVARLNLAQFLNDGEQVYVPSPGEDPPAPIGGAGGPAGGSAGGAAGGSAGGAAGGSAGGAAGGSAGGAAGGAGTAAALVDLNAADLAGLDTLPGVGPVLAQRILDWRGQHRFSTVDELGEVSGIGDKLLAQLRPLVRV